MPTPEEYQKQIQEERNKLNEYSQQALRQRQQLDDYSQQALRQQQLLREQGAKLPTSYSQREMRQTQAGMVGFERKQKVVQSRVDINKAVSDIDQALVDVEKNKKDIDEYMKKVEDASKELDKAEKEVKDYISKVVEYKEQPEIPGEASSDYSFQEQYSRLASKEGILYLSIRGAGRSSRISLDMNNPTDVQKLKDIVSGKKINLSPEKSGYYISTPVKITYAGNKKESWGKSHKTSSDYEASQRDIEYQNAQARGELGKIKETEVNPEVRQSFEAKYGVGSTFGNLQTGASNALGVGQRFEAITRDNKLIGYTDTRTGKTVDIGKFAQYISQQGIIPTAAAKDINSQFKNYERQLQNYNVKLKSCCDEQGNVLPGREYMLPELESERQRLEVLKQGCDASVAEVNRVVYQGGKIENLGQLAQVPAYYIEKGIKKAYEQKGFSELLTPFSSPTIRTIQLLTGTIGKEEFFKPVLPSETSKFITMEAKQGSLIPKFSTKEMPLSEIRSGVFSTMLYAVPIVGTGKFVADILGTSGRIGLAGTKYIKQNPLEVVTVGAGALALGIGAAARFGYVPKLGKVKIPVQGGERVIWKGIEIKGYPVVGKTGEGITFFNPSVKRLNLNGFDIAKFEFPKTALETKMLARGQVLSKLGAEPIALERIKVGTALTKDYGKIRSAFIEKELTRQIKAISPEGVGEVIKLSKKNPDVMVYGSYGAYRQLKPEYRLMKPADIDIQYKLGVTETQSFAKRILKQLERTEGKENVRISPEKPTLIETRDPITGEWHHAIDLHSKVEMPTYAKGEVRYGINIGGKMEKIEQINVMGLGEQLQRKSTASLIWQTEGKKLKVSAKVHRMKDIPSTYLVGRSVIESIPKRISNWPQIYKYPRGMQLLERWKAAYPEISWNKILRSPTEVQKILKNEPLLLTPEIPRSKLNISQITSPGFLITRKIISPGISPGVSKAVSPSPGIYFKTSPSISSPISPRRETISPGITSPSLTREIRKPSYQYLTSPRIKESPKIISPLKLNKQVPSFGKQYPVKPSPPMVSVPTPKQAVIPQPKPSPMITPKTPPTNIPIRSVRLFIPSSPIKTPKYPSEEEKKKKKKLALAWKILVKRRGAWNYLTGEYTRGEAMRVGAERTMTTLGRTFKIVPYRYRLYEGDEPDYIPSEKVFRRYKIIRGMRKPLEDIWIQKAPMSLMTRSEVREIQTEKRKAAATQRMFGNPTRRSKSKWI